MTTWISTAERAPTREDGDHNGYVLMGKKEFGTTWFGIWNDTESADSWMPIPPLPAKRDAVEEAKKFLMNDRCYPARDLAAFEALIVAIVAKEMKRE